MKWGAINSVNQYERRHRIRDKTVAILYIFLLWFLGTEVDSFSTFPKQRMGFASDSKGEQEAGLGHCYLQYILFAIC